MDVMAAAQNCMNPRCRKAVKAPRYMFCYDVLCKECWNRFIPHHRRNSYLSQRRTIRQIERQELMDPRYQSSYWPELARNLARTWAYIINDLKIEPPHVAGLEGFLKEIGL